ncbi:hypothetical protein ASZ88_00127 [Vibrio cholerae]|nr:hypothetical protein ASZ88_00127 [Vibrio cholerae]GHZ42307.1 hypothetical protein VCSRO3_3174 [Vibrio cholerae]
MPKRVAGDAFIYLNTTHGIPERFTNNTLMQMMPANYSSIRVDAGRFRRENKHPSALPKSVRVFTF